MSDETIKISVLEQRIIDLKEVILKVDDAIEKISQVNINLTKMIAVHENKIETQQQKNESLEKKIDHIYDRMERDHKNVLNEMEKLNENIQSYKESIEDRMVKIESTQGTINLKMGFVVAAFIVLAFVIENASFFSNFLGQKHLTNPDPSATIGSPK